MPKISEQVVRRFSELDVHVRAIQIRQDGDEDSTRHAEPEAFYAWASSAMNAIEGSFGAGSAHATNFKKELQSISNNFVWERRFESIRGVFFGAKSDVDEGYIFDLERSVSGEVFGDFVAAAKVALAEGNHTVAAVLACSALEDALKRYAEAQGLNVEGKTMEDVVSALKSKGLIFGAQKSLLSAMPKIRNHAMHAEWSKLQPQDAGSVVGFVEQFLLTNF